MNLFRRLLTLGVGESLLRQEIKIIKLLNLGCIVWIILHLVFIAENILFDGALIDVTLILGSITAILVLILYLQANKKFRPARLLILLVALSEFWVYSLETKVSAFMEFYFLLVPIFTLIFFNHRLLSIISLIVSYGCFTFILIFFNNYPKTDFKHLAYFGLFLGIYLSFAYFKSLNVKNERLLKKQHNEALQLAKKIEEQRLALEHQHKAALTAKAKIEQQRLELKEFINFQSQFWINISHEIRTPLTLMKGSTNKLLKSGSEQTNIKEHYQRIDQNAHKIQALIDNTIELTKIKASKLDLKLEILEIVSFCKQLLTYFEPLLTQKQLVYNLYNETEFNNIYVQADQLYLERAIANLLLNAIRYTSEKGKVSIHIHLKGPKKCSIAVCDTGRGIPQKDLPYIFQSFYRAGNSTNENGGSGVGLSFSKEVIELHKGELTVESAENKGSTFQVTLPILKSNETFLTSDTIVRTTINLDQTDILLVEDNTDMQQYIIDLLDKATIYAASNGKEALDVLDQISPQLIITDYMMPEMNGYEFIQQIRQKNIHIPVIVLTARIDRKGKLDFLRLGIDDYLTKPFNEEELLIRIKHCMDNYGEQQRTNNKTIPLNVDNNTIQDDDEFNSIKSYISQNMHSPTFSVHKLATHFALSERTLHRKIKSLSGLTPNGLIRELKLQKAKTLLENNAVHSMKELAARVGYTSTSHLSGLYEKRFGARPGI